MANDEKTPQELEAEATALAQKELADAEQLKRQQELETALEDAKTEALKWKTTSENYKKEIETKGLREKKREVTKVETKSTFDDGQLVAWQNDFLSKREDIVAEMDADLKGLKDEEWHKIEHLVAPALDAIGSKAMNEDRFASRVEIKRALEDLVKYAKGGEKVDTEKIRLEALAEKAKADMAEINGTNTTKKTKDTKVIDADEKYSEASDGAVTPEQAALIREKTAERKKEYAV